jgi:hypothetical protein
MVRGNQTSRDKAGSARSGLRFSVRLCFGARVHGPSLLSPAGRPLRTVQRVGREDDCVGGGDCDDFNVKRNGARRVGATTVAPFAVADTRRWVGGLIEDMHRYIDTSIQRYMQTARMSMCIRYERAMCHQSSNYLRREVRRKDKVTRKRGLP